MDGAVYIRVSFHVLGEICAGVEPLGIWAEDGYVGVFGGLGMEGGRECGREGGWIKGWDFNHGV